jgi:hypothetical protein
VGRRDEVSGLDMSGRGVMRDERGKRGVICICMYVCMDMQGLDLFFLFILFYGLRGGRKGYRWMRACFCGDEGVCKGGGEGRKVGGKGVYKGCEEFFFFSA